MMMSVVELTSRASSSLKSSISVATEIAVASASLGMRGNGDRGLPHTFLYSLSGADLWNSAFVDRDQHSTIRENSLRSTSNSYECIQWAGCNDHPASSDTL